MGTPRFAVPSLRRLAEAYLVVAVVTRPDKATGRGRRVAFSAAKEAAQTLGIPVMQPRTLRDEGAIAQLRGLEPEIVVVAAYGQILPPQVLSIPPFGCLNLHPSLLPKYRGPSPVAGALLAGEEETGVTIMLMDEGMDTGPILAQIRVAIQREETRGSLDERLGQVGAELLLETLPRWLAGEIEPRPQRHEEATYTKVLKKEDGRIDWGLNVEEIWRRVRAYHPWPGAYTYWRGHRLKVLRAHPLAGKRGGEPGSILAEGEGTAVVTGQGLLALEEVQLEGKKPLDMVEFLRGQKGFLGSRLDNGG